MPNSTFLKANFDLFHAKFDLFKAKSAKVDLYLVYDVFCFKDAIFNHLELDLGKIWPKTTTFGHIQWSDFVDFDTGPQTRPRIRNLTSTFWSNSELLNCFHSISKFVRYPSLQKMLLTGEVWFLPPTLSYLPWLLNTLYLCTLELMLVVCRHWQ